MDKVPDPALLAEADALADELLGPAVDFPEVQAAPGDDD